MGDEKKLRTKAQISKAIIASDKREECERQLQRTLEKQLAALIAKEKGIEIGARYYVLPTPRGYAVNKFQAEVEAVDRSWRTENSDEAEMNHITVLVKFYNRNGAFRREWFRTQTTEFTRIPK